MSHASPPSTSPNPMHTPWPLSVYTFIRDHPWKFRKYQARSNWCTAHWNAYWAVTDLSWWTVHWSGNWTVTHLSNNLNPECNLSRLNFKANSTKYSPIVLVQPKAWKKANTHRIIWYNIAFNYIPFVIFFCPDISSYMNIILFVLVHTEYGLGHLMHYS